MFSEYEYREVVPVVIPELIPEDYVEEPEQQNINKRKIQTDEIIIVIERLINNWNPTRILDYLIDRRNSNNIPNNLTVDIIKNIKRNLTNGKHVIYESELPKDTYEYYTQIINNFSKIIVKK